MSSRCDISVIIISYNCLESLKACLNSLESQAGPTYEVIVVDNNSHDGTAEYLKSLRYKYIFPGKNLGYGAAVNLAAREAAGQYLLVLNPDVIIPPNTFEALMQFASQNPDFGIISPMLTYPSGEIQISARNIPRRRDMVVGRGSPLFWFGFARESGAGYVEIQNENPMVVPAVSATAIIVRSDLFKEIGGFDERFFMYMEDIDLCKRISKKSFSIWIVPAIKVVHSWRKSSSRRPYFSSFHHHLSIYKYFDKYYPDQKIRNWILAILLCVGYIFSSIFRMAGLRGKR